MSSIVLLKDHKDHHTGEPRKKGDTISVPFGVGKDMVARGIGVYPAQELSVKPIADLESLQAENERLRARLAAATPHTEILTEMPPEPEQQPEKKGKK